MRKFGAIFGVAGVMLWGLLGLLTGGGVRAGGMDDSFMAFSRPFDPVVITGSQLLDMINAPIDELVVYAWENDNWQAIPFQIDEVTTTGVYTSFEDGLLDGNDELVFMPANLGQNATDNWVNDTEARANARSVITVTDSLHAGEIGWVYLYQSTTLTRTNDSYVAWDEPSQTVTAEAYSLAFEPDNFLGIADLHINGSADILDRQKFRVAADLAFPFPDQVFTEESVTDVVTQPIRIDLPVVGQVRAIGGSQGLAFFAFYGTRADLSFSLPVTDTTVEIIGIPVDVHFESVRMSFDLLDPAVSGMAPATYYDSNLVAGVAVNGVNDAVPTTPATDWYQIDGAVGGFVVVQSAVDSGTGTLTNYYLDDGSVDGDDTGDGMSFGDAGIFITAQNANTSIGLITVAETAYVLPAGVGNVGEVYSENAGTPFTTQTASETFGIIDPPDEDFVIYLPTLTR
jgi:hypothetical protein